MVKIWLAPFLTDPPVWRTDGQTFAMAKTVVAFARKNQANRLSGQWEDQNFDEYPIFPSMDFLAPTYRPKQIPPKEYTNVKE